MGHFTQAKVERFVGSNATGWGSHEIPLRMMWGYRKPLEAVVVALQIPSNSKIGVQHQTIGHGTIRRTLVRNNSPPLGIPLAFMEDMQEKYHLLVQEIVCNDLANYVPIAYGLNSELPERLLAAIGTFYCANKEPGDEVLHHFYTPVPLSTLINPV